MITSLQQRRGLWGVLMPVPREAGANPSSMEGTTSRSSLPGAPTVTQLLTRASQQVTTRGQLGQMKRFPAGTQADCLQQCLRAGSLLGERTCMLSGKPKGTYAVHAPKSTTRLVMTLETVGPAKLL